MKESIVSATELIAEIAKALQEADGELIKEIANTLLSPKRVDYIGDSAFEIWTLTDPACGQHGRQISERVFEFYDKRTPRTEINLNDYPEEDIENCIGSYGYTLGAALGSVVNIRTFYKDQADWIIAECLFETKYADPGIPRGIDIEQGGDEE